MAVPKQLENYAFKPKERYAAMSAGEKQYFTGRPCKHGHIAYRCTASGACKICANLSEKKSRKKLFEINPNLYKQRYAKNPERFKKQAQQYRIANKEKVKEINRKSKSNRRAKATAAERERYALKLKAMPKWLSKEDKQKIELFYECAKETSEKAGFNCNVDHIAPLKGKSVCGLHVPWNLRIVSQSYNSIKHNNLDDGILFPSSAKGVLIHSSALPWNWRKI